MRSHLLAIFVAAAVTAPASIAGEATYRSVMPDGTVRYGEAPEPGAKETRKIPPPRSSTGTILVTPEEQQKARSTQWERGGTVVLPRPGRAPEPPLEHGILQSPSSLPERRY